MTQPTTLAQIVQGLIAHFMAPRPSSSASGTPDGAKLQQVEGVIKQLQKLLPQIQQLKDSINKIQKIKHIQSIKPYTYSYDPTTGQFCTYGTYATVVSCQDIGTPADFVAAGGPCATAAAAAVAKAAAAVTAAANAAAANAAAVTGE